MRFEEALSPATLVRRYKRFLTDATLADGQEIIAHCGNPGSMRGLAEPGSEIFLSANRNPKAKLDWRWEIASQQLLNGAWTHVGINTNLANRIVEEALEEHRIEEVAAYPSLRREVRYDENSRIDFLLTGEGMQDLYLEVKSVTLRRLEGPNPDAAEFPDAVTARGAKHMAALARMVKAGHRAAILYLVQRSDCTHFTLADDIDPAYSAAFAQARRDGVEVLCYDCSVTPEAITLNSRLETRV